MFVATLIIDEKDIKESIKTIASHIQTGMF
jgi:hypothetical protein